MVFYIGDRVIAHYGNGVIVEINNLSTLNTASGTYLVVHDKPHPDLHDAYDNNLPPHRCWWYPCTALTKEVQDGV